MDISQRIIDYAIWYYLRYYPSPKKLENKLIEKFWVNSKNWKKYWWINNEEINHILNEKLRNIIQEEEVIKSKIRNYILKWKSKLYIKQKLFERMENKDLVENFLDKAFENWEIELIKKEYEKIKNKFFPLLNIWDLDYKNKQKIIEKLMRKWFKYDDIKIVIN